MKNSKNSPIKRLDKKSFSVGSLTDEAHDKDYWRTKSPEERFEHMEMLRFLNYGDQATSRLQRFFEVVDLA